MRASFLRWTLGLLAAGCAELPAVPAGQCGNGVVEAGEDCDTLGLGSSKCGQAGQSNACRLLCDQASPCPAGFGCGRDGLCRQPAGRFEALGPPLDTGEGDPLLGDVDGDRTPDLLVVGKPDFVGQRGARLLHLDPGGAPLATQQVAEAMGFPVLSDLSGDGRADLIFSRSLGAVVLAGQVDRSLTPITYPLVSFPVSGSIATAAAPVRFRPLAVNPAWCNPDATPPEQLGSGQALCAQLAPQFAGKYTDKKLLLAAPPSFGLSSLYQFEPGKLSLRYSSDTREAKAVDPGCQETKPLESIPLPPLFDVDLASLGIKDDGTMLHRSAPFLLTGGLDAVSLGGACDRIFLPIQGGTRVLILRPCGVTGTAEITWQNQASPQQVFARASALALPPDYTVQGRLHLADVNSDGLLDLLIGALDRLNQPVDIVAYGSFDGSFAFFPLPDPKGLDPYAVLAPNIEPLRDGADTPQDACPYGTPVEQPDGITRCVNLPVSTLAVGDFNGDTFPDYVLPRGIFVSILPEPDAKSPIYLPHYVNGVRLWSEAAVGDFNGDGLLDVAAVPYGSSTIDVLQFGSEGLFSPSLLAATAAVSQLRVGDVDGDQVDDLVFKEKGPLPDQDPDALTSQQGASDPLLVGDALVVAFGRKGDRPSAPQRLGRPGLIDQIQLAPLSSTSSSGNQDAIRDITVISRSIDYKELRFAMLLGEASRRPLAPFGFESAECHLSPLPANLVVGRFNKDEFLDLAVLAFDSLEGDALSRLWTVLGAGKGSLGNRSFGKSLSGSLQPLQFSRVLRLEEVENQGTDFLLEGGIYIGMRLATGDLDNDGLDEVLTLSPSKDGDPCETGQASDDFSDPFLCNSELTVHKPADNGRGGVVLEASTTLKLRVGTLLSGQVLLRDLDGDGFNDVLFNSGFPGDIGIEKALNKPDPVSGRSELFVLWNNQGTLDTTPTPLLPGISTVRGFALINVDADAEPELVVVTDDASFIARRQGRAFEPRRQTELPGGSGLAAGDVDGDGLDDLLLGRGTQAQIFRTIPRHR